MMKDAGTMRTLKNSIRYHNSPCTLKKIIIPILAMILLVPLAFSLSDEKINEMVDSNVWRGWWDNNATEENSTNQNTGNETGIDHISDTSLCMVGGCINSSVEDNHAIYADIEQYNAMEDMTVSCWLSMKDVDTGEQNNYIARNVAGEPVGTWRMFWNGGSAKFTGVFNKGGPSDNIVFSNAVQKENTEQMITIIFNSTGGSIEAWINGTFDSSIAIAGSSVTTSEDLWVGETERIATTTGWVGKMDECEIYNISLTSEQIQYKYDENVAGRHILSVITVDVTSPVISSTSINNSITKRDEDVLVSVTFTDETALDWTRIAHNISGTLTNQTLNDISGSSYNLTYNFTDNLLKGNVIMYKFWANDTSGNPVESSELTYTVINDVPLTPSIIFPTADLRSSTRPLALQVTYPADLDEDTITIYYYVNETINQTSLNNISIDFTDNKYILEVSITDGEVFSSNVSVEFEIDTILPIITITSPVATTYDTNITANVTCSDTNPFLLNYSFFNDTGQLVKTIQDNTPVGNLLEISDVIDITEIPDGNYVWNVSCSDSHTKIEIDDYYVTYQANGMMYDTAEGNRIKIMQIGQPMTPSTIKKIDRYEFLFGVSDEVEERTYKVISTWNDILVIEDSNYDAHLVIWNGNKGNWIDFESSDAQIISIERINPRHVEVTVWATDFNFKSIGGLNVITESVELTIDRAVAPAVEEEDAVLSAVLTIGGFGLIILIVIIFFTMMLKDFGIRSKK